MKNVKMHPSQITVIKRKTEPNLRQLIKLSLNGQKVTIKSYKYMFTFDSSITGKSVFHSCKSSAIIIPENIDYMIDALELVGWKKIVHKQYQKSE